MTYSKVPKLGLERMCFSLKDRLISVNLLYGVGFVDCKPCISLCMAQSSILIDKIEISSPYLRLTWFIYILLLSYI